MQTTGITLLLDLYDCKSPAINSEAVLEQLFVSALQFAGFEMVDQSVHQLPKQGITLVCIMRQSHAALHALPEAGFVAVDVYAEGKPETARAALEIIRGFLAQKLMAHSVNARFIERGSDSPKR
ncbi:MAG: adenosylmethionine decarboxylase [Chloroflexota bacterium]